MEKTKLKATTREQLKKNKVKKLRTEGFIPCVVYGNGKKSKTVTIKSNEYDKALRGEFGKNTIIKLEVDNNGKAENEFVVTYDLQRNVLTRHITHVDFLRVDEKKTLDLQVPLNFTGVAPGAKRGGVLVKKMTYLYIRTLPTNLPSSITIDLSQLEIGDFLTVEDLHSDTYEILSHPGDSIVRVAAPRVEIEPTSEAEGEAEEGEEGTEGETAEKKEGDDSSEKTDDSEKKDEKTTNQ